MNQTFARSLGKIHIPQFLKFFIFTGFITLFVYVAIIAFQTIRFENTTVPHLFAIENKDALYFITVDSKGSYLIHPLSEHSDPNNSGYYIAYAPSSLDQVIGKQIKITGYFIYSSHTFHQLNNQSTTGNYPSVYITSIQEVK